MQKPTAFANSDVIKCQLHAAVPRNVLVKNPILSPFFPNISVQGDGSPFPLCSNVHLNVQGVQFGVVPAVVPGAKGRLLLTTPPFNRAKGGKVEAAERNITFLRANVQSRELPSLSNPSTTVFFPRFTIPLLHLQHIEDELIHDRIDLNIRDAVSGCSAEQHQSADDPTVLWRRCSRSRMGASDSSKCFKLQNLFFALCHTGRRSSPVLAPTLMGSPMTSICG